MKSANKYKHIKSGILAILIGVMSVTMTACSEDLSDPDPAFDGRTREEIKQMYYELQNTADAMYADIINMQNMLGAQEAAGTPTASIGISGDGSQRLTFYSNDSKIVFPASFGYPG